MKSSGKIAPLKLYYYLLILVLLFSFSTFALAIEVPECDDEEIESYWENPKRRLLENISIHIKAARHDIRSYINHADLACFINHYFYFNIESEKEREERVQTILDLGENEVYRAAVTDAGDAESLIFKHYYENILCELHLLAYSTADGDCSREAVSILERLIADQKAVMESNKQDAQRALTRLLPEILGKIKASWVRPSLFIPGSEVKLLVFVGSFGKVISVSTERSSGDRFFDDSAELAVKKASPLPFPNEDRYYEFIREFSIGFRPEEPKITTFDLTIRSSPSNARLTVDGTYQRTTPQVVSVEKGSRRIKLTKEGYEDKELSVHVSQDTTRTVRLTKKELLLPQFSGSYFIPSQRFCTDCPSGSYFVLEISPDNISGRWDIYPGKLTYVVKKIISRESSSCSLMVEKKEAVLDAPSSVRIDFKFSGGSMEMTVHESKTQIHRIAGRLQK